jgi:hypothetical protein
VLAAKEVQPGAQQWAYAGATEGLLCAAGDFPASLFQESGSLFAREESVSLFDPGAFSAAIAPGGRTALYVACGYYVGCSVQLTPAHGSR